MQLSSQLVAQWLTTVDFLQCVFFLFLTFIQWFVWQFASIEWLLVKGTHHWSPILLVVVVMLCLVVDQIVDSVAHSAIFCFEQAQTSKVEPTQTFLWPLGYTVDVSVDKLMLPLSSWVELHLLNSDGRLPTSNWCANSLLNAVLDCWPFPPNC